ncbi:ABC transporter ATP-binding protein [Acuticoccus sediminis]|uniref:ABC transporter ATP-binding protein n=1 Tax=Acuticoccus sediminis TaxID=2184697 RepID=UPI001CFE1715|nr:ABC transporter ATP-binding protein [Acuticoccus sediminis]
MTNATARAADGTSVEARHTHGVSVAGLTKRFAGKAAVDGIDLSVAPGEFFCVLGPSGCGKSTLLRLVAGLETPDAGAITIGGQEVAGRGRSIPPEHRGVAMVFQSYALWPHMSVFQNVAFVAEAGGRSRQDAAAATAAALEAVALTPFAERKPAALSGGQQQRVALARCLASNARVLLMDEPLANLDPHLRDVMETELARVHRASGATTLYITHDQREAMALASRIAVMDAGRVLQVADPVTLYRRPANEAVARFIGRGAIVDGTMMRHDGDGALVRCGALDIAVAADRSRAGTVRVLLRPADVRLAGDGPLSGRVTRVTWRGGVFELVVAHEALGEVQLHAATAPAVGETVRFAVDGGWVLPA